MLIYTMPIIIQITKTMTATT